VYKHLTLHGKQSAGVNLGPDVRVYLLHKHLTLQLAGVGIRPGVRVCLLLKQLTLQWRHLVGLYTRILGERIAFGKA